MVENIYDLAPEQQKVRKWLAERNMPYIMVLSSESAQKKMNDNKLTPAEFLRPFG